MSSRPLPRPREFDVAFYPSCQQDVPKSNLLKAAPMPSAGIHWTFDFSIFLNKHRMSAYVCASSKIREEDYEPT